jgi:hypothetical protein
MAMYIICNKEPALPPCELALRGLAGAHSDAGWSMQEGAEVTLCTSVINLHVRETAIFIEPRDGFRIHIRISLYGAEEQLHNTL